MSKLVLLFLFLSFGLKGIAQNNKSEETIRYICLEETFQSLGVNIEEELAKLESYLIQTKQLKDSSGKSYFHFYDKIGLSNEYFSVVPYQEFTNLQAAQYLKAFNRNCLSKFDTINQGLKVNQLSASIAYLASKEETLDPTTISKTITATLSPEDFNLPYFRALFLLTIANTSFDASPNNLNQVLQLTTNQSECTIIPIRFTSTNEWLLSEEKLSEDELLRFLEHQLAQNPKHFCIKITAAKESIHAPYQALKDRIYQLYESYRKNISLRLWQKEYSQLTLSQRIQLEQSMPIRITSEVVD